jgi:UrcA family protein
LAEAPYGGNGRTKRLAILETGRRPQSERFDAETLARLVDARAPSVEAASGSQTRLGQPPKSEGIRRNNVRTGSWGIRRKEANMIHKQKVACMTAAGFLGILLVTAAATPAFSQSRVVVEAPRIDPALQRRVSYRDLNLAQVRDQNRLRGRIYRTAHELCFDINRIEEKHCPSMAIRSTRDQVAAAIQRAELRMAGKPAGPDVAITMVIAAQ